MDGWGEAIADSVLCSGQWQWRPGLVILFVDAIGSVKVDLACGSTYLLQWHFLEFSFALHFYTAWTAAELFIDNIYKVFTSKNYGKNYFS